MRAPDSRRAASSVRYKASRAASGSVFFSSAVFVFISEDDGHWDWTWDVEGECEGQVEEVDSEATGEDGEGANDDDEERV